MATGTTTGTFNYTGSNPYLRSLISGASWQSSEAVIPLDYFFQSGADPYNFNGIANGQIWAPNETESFAAAADAWNAVANINLQVTANAADADIWAWLGPDSEVQALGWSELPYFSAIEPLYMAYAYDNVGWTASGLLPGGFGYVTILHELGHMLGLAHPHDETLDATIMPGVTAAFDSYGDHDLNQGIFTVMSYNSGWETEYPFHSPFGAGQGYGWNITPGALDIAAIQEMYGANMTTALGNDVYMLPDANQAGTGWATIWDAGGTDEFSAEGSSRDFNIDLREAPLVGENAGGYVSYSDGIVGGFTIANGALIENATGGEGSDTITGNDADNLLVGNGGDDSIDGGDGADTIMGSAGADTINGGEGRDVVNFEDASVSVRFNLLNPAANQNDAAGDIYTDVEVFQAGRTNDQMFGDHTANEFYGGNRRDKLFGYGGDDTLNGENGADLLVGGVGTDLLSGGGADNRVDRFYFVRERDSEPGAGIRDIITDFQVGEDIIDLRRIDADANTAVNERFTYIGDSAFSGTAGEMGYRAEGGNTIVQADTDGDGVADFEIELTGNLTLTVDDFVL